MSAENARTDLPLDIDLPRVRNDLLQLQKLDARKFTANALDRLDKYIVADTTYVVEEANHSARRDQSEVVRAADVENAIFERQRSGSRRKLWKYLGMIGGALLGTGVQIILSMPEVSPVTKPQLLCAAALVIIGAIIVGMNVVNE